MRISACAWLLATYFVALTPVHSLWHELTEENSDHKHSPDSQTDTQDCHFCQVAFSSADKHFSWVEICQAPQGDFSISVFDNFQIPTQRKNNSLTTNKSLRAPPALA